MEQIQSKDQADTTKPEKNYSTGNLEELEDELKRLRHQKKYYRIFRSTVFSLITVAAIAVLICVLVTPVLRIYGSSMEPTLEAGNIVVSLKGAKFETGDLVAFYYNNKILVKRVIANSGDWIDINESGIVSVNDKVIEEPYISDRGIGECDITFPYQVPESRYFVLGDHRSTSVDSRSNKVGCVAEEQIVGKIVFRVWPLNEIGFLKQGGR